MRVLLYIVLWSLSCHCIRAASAAENAATPTPTPRVASLDVVRRPSPQASRMGRAGAENRLSFVQELVHNRTAQAYFATLKIGTPPQDVDVLVDTGSADLWVLDGAAGLCQSHPGTCYDTYNPGGSSTFQLSEKGGFGVVYIDNSTAKGDRVRDVVRVGGGPNAVVVEDLVFGLAKESQINTGILGLGYSSGSDNQPSLLSKLKAAGRIGARAYSLYLDDYTADTGTILFGGIDTTKFIGPLNTIDVVPLQSQDTRSHFSVQLGSIVANYSTGGGDDSQDLFDSSGAALRVLLDSGTTITYLPAQLVASIWKYFGVRDDRANTGVGLVDCNLATRMVGLTIDFHFLSGDSGNNSITTAAGAAAAEADLRPVIKVPFSEFILDNINSDSNITLPADLGFEKVCSFGLLDSPGGGAGALSILGQNFLRSAYVVYDLDHHDVGLAQANLEGNGSSSTSAGNIIEITEDEGIPSVTGAGSVGAGSPTTSSSSGGGGGGGGGPQPTGPHQNDAADSWRRQVTSTGMVMTAAGMLASVWVIPAFVW